MSEKRPGIDIVLKRISEIDKPVVVDIGAYIGKIGRLCREVNPNTIVHAIEPEPENYKLIKGSYVYNYAIGYPERMVSFYVINRKEQKGSSQSNSLYPIKNSKKIKVKCITLSRFLKENNIKHIDLLKINCEGGEYEIFGSNVSFLSIIDMIFMSLHIPKKNKKIFDILKFYGFKLISDRKWQIWVK